MMDKLALKISQRFAAEHQNQGSCGCETSCEHMAVAPPGRGWEHVVKELKKEKDVDNPFAVAWYMKNKGDKTHKEAELAERVAARYLERIGMEHPSEKAKRDYLKEHPNADPSNHTVTKGKSDRRSKPAPDLSAEASKAKARAAETSKHYELMQDLKKKVDDANPTAKKKFDRAYDKMYENGEAAAKDAKKLIEKVENSVEDDSEAAYSIKLLQYAMQDWNNIKIDHASAKGAFAHKKMLQAEQTWAYAKKIDDEIERLTYAVKFGH